MKLLYEITKQGNNEYSLTYKLVPEKVQQQQFISITKKDADGTVTSEDLQIAPSSIASIISTSNPGEISKGFYSNLDVSNLAVGGTLYEIESVTGYEESGSSTGPFV